MGFCVNSLQVGSQSVSLGLRDKMLYRMTSDFFAKFDYVIVICCWEHAIEAACVQ